MTTAWLARYGEEAPAGLPDLGRLLNHRSVRQFDAARTVEEPVAAGLVAAAQSASTSSHLQLWTVVSIQQPERREEAAKLCGDQQQIRDAAWFFAFCADHYRLKSGAGKLGEDPDALPLNEMYTMAAIDAALAAERMACAAEHLGLGVCYIGALRNNPEGIRDLLSLPHGVVGLFGLCIGWPAAECAAEIKPRLSQSTVWMKERYDSEVSTAEFDERMRGFYEAQGMKGEFSWTARSARRTRKGKISGREAFGAFLRQQGMDLS